MGIDPQSVQAVNGFPDIKVQESKNGSSLEKNGTTDVPSSARARAPHSVLTSAVKKPLGAKKTGKTGGLGARKLSSKVDPAFNLCPICDLFYGKSLTCLYKKSVIFRKIDLLNNLYGLSYDILIASFTY